MEDIVLLLLEHCGLVPCIRLLCTTKSLSLLLKSSEFITRLTLACNLPAPLTPVQHLIRSNDLTVSERLRDACKSSDARYLRANKALLTSDLISYVRDSECIRVFMDSHLDVQDLWKLILVDKSLVSELIEKNGGTTGIGPMMTANPGTIIPTLEYDPGLINHAEQLDGDEIDWIIDNIELEVILESEWLGVIRAFITSELTSKKIAILKHNNLDWWRDLLVDPTDEDVILILDNVKGRERQNVFQAVMSLVDDRLECMSELLEYIEIHPNVDRYRVHEAHIRALIDCDTLGCRECETSSD